MNDEHLEPLSWWESVRAAGLLGGKATDLSLHRAVELLERDLRGRRRRQATKEQIGELAREARGQYQAGERAGADVFEVLRTVLQLTEPPVPEDLLVDLAMSVGGTADVAVVADRTGRSDLLELVQIETSEGVVATVDIEMDPITERITEVAVARSSSQRRIATLDWSGCPASAVSHALEKTILFAHNGHDHDFPRLEGSGVNLPDSRSDTLRWSWLAFPKATSHGQQALAGQLLSQDDVGIAHTAKGDAETLLALVPEIAARLLDLPESERYWLRQTLAGHEQAPVLDRMLGKPAGGDVTALHAPTGTPLQLSTDAPWRYAREIDDGPISQDDVADSVVVGRDLRHADESIEDGPRRWRVDGRRAIDVEKLTDSLGARGWADAVAIRVVQTGGGCLDLSPPSAARVVSVVPVCDPGPLVLGAEGPVLSDMATTALHPTDLPVMLLDPLDTVFGWPSALLPLPESDLTQTLDEQDRNFVVVAEIDEELRRSLANELELDPRSAGRGRVSRRFDTWWWSPASLDPIAHEGPLSIVGPRLGLHSPTATKLWEEVLGGPFERAGRDQRLLREPITVVSGVPAGTAPSDASVRALARVLAVTGNDKKVALRTSFDRAERLRAELASWWRDATGTPLLFPPAWPTAADAAGRLRSGTALACVTWSERALDELSSEVEATVIDRLMAPDRRLPILQRLLEEVTDPYREIVEPLSALSLIRLLGRSPVTVVLDPVVDSPVVRELVDLGQIRRVHLDEYTDLEFAHDAAKQVQATRDGAIPYELVVDVAKAFLPAGGQLHDFQELLLQDLSEGNDALGVFRTGSGKSVVFQAFALALAQHRDESSIVLSPLISLQRNQLDSLRRLSVWEATLVNSELDPVDRAGRLRGISAGFYRLVYLAPEALHSPSIRRALQAAEIGFVAIDEAHVITEQGHDFRPDYRLIEPGIAKLLGVHPSVRMREISGRPRFLAVTGTATPSVREDIAGLLGLPFRQHVDGSFIRSELRFSVLDVTQEKGVRELPWDPSDSPRRAEFKWPGLLDILETVGRPTILYASTRRETELLADAIARATGERCAAYHAGVQDRDDLEQRFFEDELDVIVATNAFGMGVDKDDVKAVVHWTVPPTPEALYQEAGRAGRGPAGQPADCVLLYHDADLDFVAWLDRQGQPDRTDLEGVLRAVEELRDTSPDPSRIRTTDEDLEALASIRDGVEARVVLAQLERVGLIREIERERGLAHVHIDGVADPQDRVEEAVLAELGSAEVGETVLLNVYDVISRLEDQGIEGDAGLVWAASRSLKARGALHQLDLIRARPLGLELSMLRKRFQQLRALALQLHESMEFQRGDTIRCPTPEGLAPIDVRESVAALAAIGAVTINRRGSRSSLPWVRRRGDLVTLMRGLGPLVEAVVRVVEEGGSDVYEISELRDAVGEDAPGSAADLERALLVAHFLGAVTFDPSSWQRDGSVGRVLTVESFDADRRDAALSEAEAAIDARRFADSLKRRALKRYAHLEPADDFDVYQAYLERYFTDDTFLDDLASSDAAAALVGLNERQQKAVTATAGRVVIVAGAGSGKTRTLTRRLGYRVARGRVDPQRVVAITFTRLAAQELRTRLGAIGVSGVRAQTIHSLAYEIVRHHFTVLGYESSPDWLEAGPRRRLAARIFSQFRSALGLDVEQILEVVERIGYAGNTVRADLEHRWSAVATDRPWDPIWTEVIDAWESALIENSVIDGGMVVPFAERVLRHEESLRFRRAVDEVFVDEYQDVNPADHELVMRLTGTGSLTVVGDPRQAIYAWRGADPRLLERLAAESSAVVTPLTVNYRSSQSVIAAANRWAATFSDAPALTPDRDIQGALRVERAGDDGLIEAIRRHLAQGTPDAEIAILVRGTRSLNRLKKTLRDVRIPTRGSALPPIDQTTAFRVLRDLVSSAPTLEQARPLSDWLEGHEVEGLVESKLRGVDADATEANLADWERLVSDMKEMENTRGAIAPEALLEMVVDRDRRLRREEQAEDSGVHLLTVHKAKGREFDVVLIADADNRSWYADKANSGERDRIWYVAITRARHLVEAHLDRDSEPFSGCGVFG